MYNDFPSRCSPSPDSLSWAVFANPRHDDSFDLLGLDFSASAVPKTQVWKQLSLTMFVSLCVLLCFYLEWIYSMELELQVSYPTTLF